MSDNSKGDSAAQPKKKKTSVTAGLVRNEQMGARRAVIEELFNDMYHDRRNIYIMNLVRGIFFGAGSAIGGTIVVALVVWALSLFVNIPGIGQSFQQAQDSIKTEKR